MLNRPLSVFVFLCLLSFTLYNCSNEVKTPVDSSTDQSAIEATEDAQTTPANEAKAQFAGVV